ncbi:uncharacterized protein LOC110630904 [Manihot esculenta]|nr:uncharacterized protein LOC110630904 [Manihot esculenta]
MMEIIKENGADADKQKSNAGNSHQSASFRRSDVSGASVKSFAFPILTGDHKMDNSSKQNASSPITPKASQEQDLQQKSQEGTSNPEPSNKPSNAGPSKWFSCLPCFSSRN